jgi:hypothetical protein
MFLDEKNMMKGPYRPYSPGLAPCNFFLCDHIKKLLRKAEFPDPDSLFDSVTHILTGPEKTDFE